MLGRLPSQQTWTAQDLGAPFGADTFPKPSLS